MNKLSKEELSALYDALPHGSKTKIANLAGCSEATVYRYFNGLTHSGKNKKKIEFQIYCIITKCLERIESTRYMWEDMKNSE